MYEYQNLQQTAGLTARAVGYLLF